MNRKTTKQYAELRPFEVISLLDKKVAINTGTIVFGTSSISFKDCQFTSDAKPQNLLNETIDETRLLTVKEDDFVCILIEDSKSSLPSVKIEAINAADLSNKEDYKRGVNKIYKLAKIKTLDTESGYFEVEYLFLTEVIIEIEHFPPFTPIIWPIEKKTSPTNPPDPNADCEVKHDTWNAVFIPGSIYIPTTMTEATVFQVDGKSMLDFPIIQIKEGDTFWVKYEVDKNWAIKGIPSFEKSETDPTIVETIPIKPPDSCSDNCAEIDGSYGLKILTFEKKALGISATMYWKSDITMSTWKRCSPACDPSVGSTTGGSSDSSTGSDKSTAIVPANWSPTGYTALFVEEAPEVWFHDCLTAKITGRITEIPIDHKYISVCERGRIWVSGICGDKPAKLGAKIIDDKIIVTSGFFFKPTSVNITLTGVRRGFLGQRFPTRTKKQFIENEIFINSAYSST